METIMKVFRKQCTLIKMIYSNLKFLLRQAEIAKT